MSKRSSDDSQAGASQCKKVQFEPIRLGAISSLEEMDMKVLQFQNKKLTQVQKNTVNPIRDDINRLPRCFFFCSDSSRVREPKPN